MKKTLIVSLLMVVVLMLIGTGVKAANYRDDLVEAIIKEAAKAGIELGETEVKNTLPENVSEQDYNDILDDIEDIKTEYKGTDYKSMSKETKDALLKDVQNSAARVKVTVSVDTTTNNITVKNPDGKATITRTVKEDGTITKVQQTGSDNLVYVVLAGVAIIAIAGTVVVKKARANA